MKRAMVLLAILVASLVVRPTFAADPVIQLYEAHAFRHILENDDLVILIRYELPTSDWRTTDYMVDPTCDDETDLDDPCWTSLNRGIVHHTLYDGPRGTGNLKAIRTPARVGDSLYGLYLAAGHGLTWGDTTYQTCLEGSPTETSWTTQPHSCKTLSWHDSADMEATPDVMDDYLVQMMLNLEEDFPKPSSTFVAMDRISDEGVRFAREAFPAIMSVVPDAFISSVQNAGVDFSPSGTPSALESTVQSEAQASTLYINASTVMSEFFGLTGRIGTGALTALAALVLTAGVARWTDMRMGLLAGMGVMAFGVWQWFVPMPWAFVVLAAMLLLGSAAIFTRIPSAS